KIKLIVAPSDRKTLHDTIARRFRNMLELGFIEEVEKLYRRGDLTEKMPSIRAVGYREVWAYLQGDYDLETMTEKAIIATRPLAKRQFTWLRRENDAISFQTGQTDLLPKVLTVVMNSRR
ncbi:MAG: tRNA (adenosine(37)-N6)-dimethylallyltransferase MiaA, partial [Methylococcaceae bacterium]|nr:tRNA (adenosine(37)-N6)-dimethylallyltransferase MiaA [Methylococcaceae bacterium]